MTQQTSGGLMQALAPIASRRPVHMIVSGGSDGLLHFVCQPLQLDEKEDPEIARGFAVDASPEELDRDLPRLVAEGWVPAHQGLQSVLDQVAAATEQARQTTLRKEKDKGKGKGNGGKDAGSGDAQTTLAPPPAAAAPAPAPEPAAEAPAGEGAAASVEPGLPAPAPATTDGGDRVSSLFD